MTDIRNHKSQLIQSIIASKIARGITKAKCCMEIH